MNGAVRSLRSRTVRSAPTADEAAVQIITTSETDNGPRSGMRLRNKKTLDSTPQSATSGGDCSASPLEADGACDVYDFTDSENDGRSKKDNPTISTEECAVSTVERPVTPTPISQSPCQPALITSPGGRLKLTLRMKRSPVLDEVIESGSSMGGSTHLHQQNHTPVYEVLRVEGLEMEPEEELQKNRMRRTQRRRSPPVTTKPSQNGMLPTTKRLRLIFGNESHTIDLPPTNLSNFSPVE